MKSLKKIFPLIAVVLGVIAVFAFKPSDKTSSNKLDAYYWFELNANNGSPKKATVQPVLLSADPNSCPTGTTHFCSGGYTNFIDNHDGTYSADGARAITDMKN
jgi:hypothetical protein